MKNNKNRKTKLPLVVGIVIAVIVAIIMVVKNNPQNDSNIKTQNTANEVTVHFVDVGQGDCEIIQTQNCNVIIDAGENTAKDAVLSYVKKLGITKFDYVIATHPHSDHIGSLDDVIKNYDIGTIIMPQVKDDLVPTTSAYKNLLNSISKKELKIHKAIPDETFDLDGATLTVLGPLSDYDDLNSYSVVCKLTYKNKSFLFSGDAQKDAELDIIEKYQDALKADVYKVGHHGSKSSSCNEYLSKIKPEYAVISCGVGNDYGHPHKTLMDRLKNINVLRTDEHGSIVFTTDGNELSYKTQK